MEKDSPKDKFLKACGVTEKTGRDRENKKYPEEMLNRADTASAWAQQAQNEADETYRRLNAYIRDELPSHLVQALEKVAQNEIGGRLRPLENSVHQAANQIESCAENLAGISWNGRLIWVAVLIGVATVSVGACLVRWTLIEDKFDEERRYELYGRKVEANIERYGPKDKEKLYKHVGGRP